MERVEIVPCLDDTFDIVYKGAIVANLPNLLMAASYARKVVIPKTTFELDIVVGSRRFRQI